MLIKNIEQIIQKHYNSTKYRVKAGRKVKNKKIYKFSIISLTNTVIKHDTMMIKLIDTIVAYTAMTSFWWFIKEKFNPIILYYVFKVSACCAFSISSI